MNARQKLIADSIGEHVTRIVKLVGYPTVWSHISEAEMEKVIKQISDEVIEAVQSDPVIQGAIEETELVTNTGKINAIGIYHAIGLAAKSMKEPIRTRMNHLAKNAEVTFRAARLLKEPT